MLRYRLPDGRSWKRLWEGWVGSFMMLLVLLEQNSACLLSAGLIRTDVLCRIVSQN